MCESKGEDEKHLRLWLINRWIAKTSAVSHTCVALPTVHNQGNYGNLGITPRPLLLFGQYLGNPYVYYINSGFLCDGL